MSSTSKRYCSVPQCNSYKSSEVTIHRFPNDEKLRQKWAIALRIGKPITSGMSVCSLHFTKEDYSPHAPFRKNKLLKKNVVPSCKIPHRTHEQPLSLSALKRAKRQGTSNRKKVRLSVHDEYCNDDVADPIDNTIPTLSGNELVEIEKCLGLSVEDKAVQVNTFIEEVPNKKYSFIDFLLDNDRNMKLFTGVKIEVVKKLMECVLNIVCNDSVYTKSGQLLLDIVIVLIKIKLNLSFRILSALIYTSETTTRNHFHNMVPILAKILKPFIYWPSKQETLNNMPICFSQYKKTRVVLDCTEVLVQTPSCLKCRLRCYSHYKSGYTVKMLIGVTPAGTISYVSPAYGGRASDKAIFNRENVIGYLDPFLDAVMVDKGFMIEKECLEANITLIRPPFLRKKKQFSKSEAEETATIARARVHVERVIQRFKLNAIFKNKLEWSLIPFVDDIASIVAALVNLSPRILADDKF